MPLLPDGFNGEEIIYRRHNPARINCASVVREALVNNWSALFTGAADCRTATCTRLQHAFRRDDLAGTTDIFLTLVGMHAVPPSTTACTPNVGPLVDVFGTANPFCNAGLGYDFDELQNKGDSDYQNLDPIRRSVHRAPGAAGAGLEEVGEAFTAGNGLPNNTDAQCPLAATRVTTPGPTFGNASAGLKDHSYSNNQGMLALPGAFAALRADLEARRCNGLVMPVSVPANFRNPEDAYYAAPGGVTPVLCTPGEFVPKIINTTCAATCVCADGSPQPCLVPVNRDVPGVTNFNCLARPIPVPIGYPGFLSVRDSRVFNLRVMWGTNLPTSGTVARDNYFNTSLGPNPNCPAGLSAARQARVVNALYRLHTNRATNLNGSAPTRGTPLFDGDVCRTFSSTLQIGCLVKANACSIGFAGLTALTHLPSNIPVDNMAFRIEDIAPSIPNVQNLILSPPGLGTTYRMSHTLWVNSLKEIGVAGAVTGAEGTLMSALPGCFRDNAAVDAAISNHHFVPVPAGVTRLQECPSPFPLR
ncbi:MAG: hypothetical protein H7Y19_03055 [Luteimonas sp.]|nr:hypothetical protein [Luteimonas sp.]